MILIWRGWGLLAVVALFPLIASCAGLTNVKPDWVMSVAWILSLLIAGLVCVHFGVRWNRPVSHHTFFFLPLQVWGWVYLGLVSLISAFWVLAGLAVLSGLYRPPNAVDPNRGIVFTVVGVFALGVTAIGSYASVRSARVGT